MTESSILAFYRHTSTDHRGRTLADTRSFSLDDLEHQHDYIQWLFPLPEGSGVLPQAPRLSELDAEVFAADPALREELLRSLDLMLAFYGLERLPGSVVVPSSHFAVRLPTWLTRGNHNHLRLTRILRSLSLLGLSSEARALLACLEDIVGVTPGVVSDATRRFWHEAVRRL